MAQLRMAVEGLAWAGARAADAGIQSRCTRVAQSQRDRRCRRSHPALGFTLSRTQRTGMGSAQRPKPVRRGRSDNHGHADWISMCELRRLFPGPDTMHGGIVVGEAYRVDQDTVSRVAFDPRDQHTWGQGGAAPLLIDPCDDGPTHSLIFAGSGGFKTVSAVSTMLDWIGPAVALDPSCEMGPMLRDARKSMGQRAIELAPARSPRSVSTHRTGSTPPIRCPMAMCKV